MLKLCVAGAAGRMGNAIIAEATSKGHQVVAAIEAAGNPCIGKTLRELGVANSDTRILGAGRLREALQNADTYVSFTVPAAEVVNIPVVAELGKRIILGTTGFTAEQNRQVVNAMSGKVPAVFSPNYSVGVNVLFKLAESLKAFPAGYNFSVSEYITPARRMHQAEPPRNWGKSSLTPCGYGKVVSGREGMSPRQVESLKSKRYA